MEHSRSSLGKSDKHQHLSDLLREERLWSLIYVLLLGLLMFIRFTERGTAVFSDLCLIVRIVDVYQANLININNPSNNT
jgi:uncharacterized membrane protein YobD (UPF0266 family)